MSLLEWLKIWSKFYRMIPILKDSFRIPPPRKWKLSESLGTLTFQFRRKVPPPPKIEIIGRSWHFVTFQFQNSPPPPKFKFRQILALCHFSVSEYPPPQLKLRQILAICHFSVSVYPPPPNWNLGRSWSLCQGVLTVQTVPPPNWNSGRSWHWVTFQFQNVPPKKIEI